METPAERAARIERLEARRAERRADIGTWPLPDDPGMPLQVAPGRGDLNFSSAFLPTFPTALSLIGNRTVSFARIFMSQPWVAAAVMRMLTWSVRVPLKVYRKLDDNNSRIRLLPKEHPLAAAVVNPWDRGTQAAFVQALFGPMLVHGNSVMKINNGANDKIGFATKDWRFTRPIMPFRDTIAGWTFDYDQPNFKEDVSIDDVIHTAWWSPIGPIGTSPLQQLGTTIQIEDAAQRYQRALFLNGGRPPSAITMTEEFLSLDRKERQAIMAQVRADVDNIYGTPENGGKPALLPPGLDWKGINGSSAVEAELIQQRKIAREEVAGVYLIPPTMFGILDKATLGNMETQREMTYTDCVGPPLVVIEQVLTSQIIRALMREDDVYAEFDFGGVLRGDRLQEIEALRAAIGSALMVPNEGRDILNLPRSDNPGMDKFYLPTNNLQPVGTPPRTPVALPVGQESGASRSIHVRSFDADYEKAMA